MTRKCKNCKHFRGTYARCGNDFIVISGRACGYFWRKVDGDMALCKNCARCRGIGEVCISMSSRTCRSLDDYCSYFTRTLQCYVCSKKIDKHLLVRIKEKLHVLCPDCHFIRGVLKKFIGSKTLFNLNIIRDTIMYSVKNCKNCGYYKSKTPEVCAYGKNTGLGKNESARRSYPRTYAYKGCGSFNVKKYKVYWED